MNRDDDDDDACVWRVVTGFGLAANNIQGSATVIFWSLTTSASLKFTVVGREVIGGGAFSGGCRRHKMFYERFLMGPVKSRLSRQQCSSYRSVSRRVVQRWRKFGCQVIMYLTNCLALVHGNDGAISSNQLLRCFAVGEQ